MGILLAVAAAEGIATIHGIHGRPH